MHNFCLPFIIFSFLASCIAQEETDQSFVKEPALANMRSIEIYDSVSTSYPYELRERGIAYYSPWDNRTGRFIDTGLLSRPLESIERGVYRIGTDEFLATSKISAEIVEHADALDETLVLHLDLMGSIFYGRYSVKPASTNSGTFTVYADPATAHMGPEVRLQPRVIKTRTTGSPATTTTSKTENGAGTAQSEVEEEEEEEGPEKTFLQKYWIYAVPLVLLLVLGGGGEGQ